MIIEISSEISAWRARDFTELQASLQATWYVIFFCLVAMSGCPNTLPAGGSQAQKDLQIHSGFIEHVSYSYNMNSQS